MEMYDMIAQRYGSTMLRCQMHHYWVRGMKVRYKGTPPPLRELL